MTLGLVNKAAPVALFAVCALFITAACESNAADKPSLVPLLTELKPAIFCVDAASNETAAIECLRSYGIAGDGKFSDEPRSSDDFAQRVLVTWAGVGRGGTAHLSSQHFNSAISYATCVETATHSLQGLEGELQNAIAVGNAKVVMSCADELLSVPSVVERHPEILTGKSLNLSQGEAKGFMLARIFAGAAYKYVIEANGWVRDEMRPCVRYLDGRPPSASCANEPRPRVFRPPSPYSPK